MDKTTQDHVERIASDPDDSPQKHLGIDEELRKYVAAADSVQVDEVTSKRLRHMINKRVLIIMVGTYFLQSLDKNAISYAAIMGIQKDANLKGQDVNIPESDILGYAKSRSIPGFIQSYTLVFCLPSIQPTSLCRRSQLQNTLRQISSCGD